MATVQTQSPEATLVCTPASPSLFEKALNEFDKTLQPLLEAATSEKENIAKEVEKNNRALCILRRENRYIFSVSREYINFNNCIALAATKDVEELTGTVKDEDDKNKKLSKDYQDVLDKIKVARQKIEQVKTVFKKLQDDIIDQCNTEEHRQIDASIGNEPNKKYLKDSVSEMVGYVRNIKYSLNDVSESAVRLAGINASINTKGLVDTTVIVKKGGDDFVKDIDLNLKNLATDYEKSKNALGTGQKTFGTSAFKKYKAVSKKRALEWDKKLAEKPDCANSGGLKKLDELVKNTALLYNESLAVASTQGQQETGEEQQK